MKLQSHAIVDPSCRPVDSAFLSRVRFRAAVALIAIGFITILISDLMPSLAHWLFTVGTIAVVFALFLLGRFVRRSRKDRDIRKLYRDQEI